MACGRISASGGTLYVGGGFTTAGGNPPNYIAQWDGNTWSPLGSGIDKPANALAATTSTLYVGGDFITAGGKVSAYAAMASLGVSGPVITQDAALGFTNGIFGFNISGPAGSNIVIDYSTNLEIWIPLQTNLLGTLRFISPIRSPRRVSNVSTAPVCCPEDRKENSLLGSPSPSLVCALLPPLLCCSTRPVVRRLKRSDGSPCL